MSNSQTSISINFKLSRRLVKFVRFVRLVGFVGFVTFGWLEWDSIRLIRNS